MFLSCRVAAIKLVKLAAKVLPEKDLASIKFHCIVDHAWRDVLNHGNPYNHDAQGVRRCQSQPQYVASARIACLQHYGLAMLNLTSNAYVC